jgi:hypothetical protein
VRVSATFADHDEAVVGQKTQRSLPAEIDHQK